MVINVASFGGRSHMLDLARELENKVMLLGFIPMCQLNVPYNLD